MVFDAVQGQNRRTVASANKFVGNLVEYLDQSKLRTGLVIREQGNRVGVLEPGGREKVVSADLILLQHPDSRINSNELAAKAAAIDGERSRLASELDLNLLWEVVREQGRSFTAAELAELFFGERSTIGTAVVLESLLNDRLYFSRRHMEFVPNGPDQVEKLRIQYDKARFRNETFRKTQTLIRQIFADHSLPPAEAAASLIEDLRRYLENPSTRSKDLTTMLSQAAPELAPAEIAFEILERLGAAPATPRYVLVGGLHKDFGEQALAEVHAAGGPSRPALQDDFAVTIDDEETREIDDALSCEMLDDGSLRVRIHIALVADFVSKRSALDREAAARATTVYLPEATVRMLPDELSCDRASLIAGVERPVLTTELRLANDGELLDFSIFPSTIKVARRLSYEEADQLLTAPSEGDPAAALLTRLDDMANKLRERRRRSGAVLFQRREAKVRVRDGQIEIKVLETRSQARQMVAEFMVLGNSAAARFASEHSLPIIYRIQPHSGGDFATQKPRLSLYPEFHAGMGLDFYAQVSSPIRRYADLVLQRQLVAALADSASEAYRNDELLTVLANAEAADVELKELERKAKRYWTLRYLKEHEVGRPLRAVTTREGAGAELLDYATRGTLRGAPTGEEREITVRIARVDPLRGWLVLDYLGLAAERSEIRAT
jgi:exoribonuclease-2